MLSKDRRQQSEVRSQEKRRHLCGKVSLCLILCFLFYPLWQSPARAEIIDRVVAYVDQTAITLSEFREASLRMKEKLSNLSDEEVINSMINRIVLIKEARKLRFEASTDDDLLKEYVDFKIRSLIIIKEDAINGFYRGHPEEFKGRDYLSVRDEIEQYLIAEEANRQLKRLVEELREKVEIRIQLQPSGL
jgi:hypothetical protein